MVRFGLALPTARTPMREDEPSLSTLVISVSSPVLAKRIARLT